MGKSEKNNNRQQKQRHTNRREGRRTRGREEHGDVDDDPLPSHAFDISENKSIDHLDENDEEEVEEEATSNSPSRLCKFQLYQESVQSPKGDISYLQKFFLMYVGGRLPLHLQEDFCGTALLSTEWLRSDPRRTAIGVDLDHESLTWCLHHNLTNIGSSFDCYSRMALFHGNVLKPKDAILVIDSSVEKQLIETFELPQCPAPTTNSHSISLMDKKANENHVLPPRDIICAFNYSCCCLHTRADLLLYFKHVIYMLSTRGGIFVMDLYGGTSSEQKIQLRRRYPNFTYIWEQAEFDILSRKTRISLHYQVAKKKTLRHAFSYDWRLWTLPEIKECLEEVGFQSVHFWMREMPDTRESGNVGDFCAASDIKYKESSSFLQRDAWNAYIVGVAQRKVIGS